MRDNAAAARALRADEYESRFLRPVEVGEEPVARRREPRPRAYGSGRSSTAGNSGRAMNGGSTRLATGSAAGVPGRRTVHITRPAAPPRRRSTTSTALVARPDRTAMWAFVLALFLVLMAVATAHAGVERPEPREARAGPGAPATKQAAEGRSVGREKTRAKAG